MSKEKQIKEMVTELGDVWIVDLDGNPYNLSEKLWNYELENIAIELYNLDYRKQSVGEWISNELGGYRYAFYCSECGWVDGYPFNDRHKYCPNCGAKMKGGEYMSDKATPKHPSLIAKEECFAPTCDKALWLGLK